MFHYRSVSWVFLLLAVLLASSALAAAPPGEGDPARPPECRARPAGIDEPAAQTHSQTQPLAPAAEGAARLKQPQLSPPGMHPHWHRFLPGMFR